MCAHTNTHIYVYLSAEPRTLCAYVLQMSVELQSMRRSIGKNISTCTYIYFQYNVKCPLPDLGRIKKKWSYVKNLKVKTKIQLNL